LDYYGWMSDEWSSGLWINMDWCKGKSTQKHGCLMLFAWIIFWGLL
jgi:hypothetical protein